jgi:hypothetical protein
MRPNQNNNNKNRSRGRNNNGGRKHINPLSRNFESNGPDVKVRGNAAHIAEKYLQLARDAQSSGDSVMAENYLQHAEHYFRIVAAAQPQNRDQFGQQTEAEDFDDDFPPMNDRFASPEPRQPFPQPTQGDQQPQQPAMPEAENGETVVIQAVPAETAEAQQAQGEAGAEGRRHRDRRPRRRSRGNGEGGTGEAGADPGNAPQPDIGLPAFLTAGGSAAE